MAEPIQENEQAVEAVFTPTLRLTKEIRTALAAPIPEEFIDTVDKGARGTFRVALVDYLELRAAQVDPDWSDTTKTNGEIVTKHITICGVTHAGEAGVEPVAALPGERGWKSYHMRVGAAAAAAERRAFAKFGLGAELWPKHVIEDEEGEAVAPTTRPTPTWKTGSGKPQAQTAAPRSGYSGNARGRIVSPSQKQMELLTGDLQVPEDIAMQLDNRDNSRENPSQASLVISTLISARREDRNAYDRDPGKQVRLALAANNASHLLQGAGNSRSRSRDNEYDED